MTYNYKWQATKYALDNGNLLLLNSNDKCWKCWKSLKLCMYVHDFWTSLQKCYLCRTNNRQTNSIGSLTAPIAQNEPNEFQFENNKPFM